MKRVFSVALQALLLIPLAEANLVYNGSFELGRGNSGKPKGWETSGHRDIRQSLGLVAGHRSDHGAELSCSAYRESEPAAHVMACQVGRIAIKKDQWYRLSFWSRGSHIDRHICQARLMDMRTWKSSGISVLFAATPTWRYSETFGRSTVDIPASDSRLQFWFNSTGSLWLDDIKLEPVEMEAGYRPELQPGETRNLLYNGSFECGLAGWGSYTPELPAWPGNLFRPLCNIDTTTSSVGTHSLRIEANSPEAPVFQWDYRDASPKKIKSPFAAHRGWAKVRAGQPYTFSCYLKSSKPGMACAIRMRQSEGRSQYQYTNVGTSWQRHSFRFVPESSHIWLSVGPKPGRPRNGERATLWLDGVQLELGSRPSTFRHRSRIEVALSTSQPGNIFSKPKDGIRLSIDFHNASAETQNVVGRLVAMDFFDQEVLNLHVEQEVPALGRARKHLSGILAERQGYYRFAWRQDGMSPDATPSLRTALLSPYPYSDSAFGMNHPFPWKFMLPLCKSAGLTWMRNWAVSWEAVEPTQGSWDFSHTDVSISRMQEAKLNTLLLLPFPSASWNSTATEEGKQDHVTAYASRIPGSFQNYIEQSVRQYRDGVDCFAVLNEPVYTMYALPERYGYSTADYVSHLETAYTVIKAEKPDSIVIGGIGAWTDRHWVREFIEGGGLQWCDVMDLHLYPATIPPELFEADLVQCRNLMQKHGGAKPMWLTEFGCYADDDPHMIPSPTIGDSAMSRANWPNERAASEALVKTAAVFLSTGVEKIFYHGGTCGVINEKCGGSVFFEYGGTPRKMYAAQNALARILGPAPQPIAVPLRADGVSVYGFDTGNRISAIVWSTNGEMRRIKPGPNVAGADIMGNSIKVETLEVSATPVYLTAPVAADLALD